MGWGGEGEAGGKGGRGVGFILKRRIRTGVYCFTVGTGEIRRGLLVEGP